MPINKGSKMKLGWKNILKNEIILLSHTRKGNVVNRIKVSIHKLARKQINTSTKNIRLEG